MELTSRETWAVIHGLVLGTLYLQAFGAQPVQCWGDTLDRYGRTIARCRVGDQDIEQALVRDGWALAYVRYSRDYMDEDIAARLAGRGMRAWRCETPSAYRRRT